ncbi:MAG: deoxyguanosinetriphosphate triphosphohydrolase [Rhizomicrobium sp.]
MRENDACRLTPAPAGHLLGTVFVPPRNMASFATLPDESRGRLYPEDESTTRTCYARDRDRIIHSTAFRRLMHKTQVFLHGKGDLFRTRLTHSLEVAQIARSFARVLALDEDLAEAIALAHDVGHAPFGHTGEEALDACAKDIGGFDHNAHALRLLTKLEHRYAAFDGLNLTWEMLEGLVKHNGPITGAKKPIPAPIARFDGLWSLELDSWPGLEAQVAALADDIAYLNHDIDDGLRSGLISLDVLTEAPFAGDAMREVRKLYGDIERGRMVGEMIRILMGQMTADLLTETKSNLAALGPWSVANIRKAGKPLAGFSPPVAKRMAALKRYLFIRLYRHPQVIEQRERQKILIRELYQAYCHDPNWLPKDWASLCDKPGDAITARIVRDYIAGMTDNFALQEYDRLFHNENTP